MLVRSFLLFTAILLSTSSTVLFAATSAPKRSLVLPEPLQLATSPTGQHYVFVNEAVTFIEGDPEELAGDRLLALLESGSCPSIEESFVALYACHSYQKQLYLLSLTDTSGEKILFPLVRHWGSKKFEEEVVASGCSIEEFATLYIWLHRFEFSGEVVPDEYCETHVRPALGSKVKLYALAEWYMKEGDLGTSYPSTMKAEGRVVTPGHSPRGTGGGTATGRHAPRGLNF